jgi:DNA polymerase-3 subunit beta
MKTSCLLNNLDRALSIVGRAVATRSTLPVLSNILLATENGRLKLSATNLEIGITCWIGAKVDEGGAVTVPARTLVDLVGVLPDERVDMSLDDHTQTLNLKCGRFTGNLRGIDASEFPAFPSVDDANVARIDPEVLRSAINQVVFAARAATEESRPILTGVFAQFANDSSGVGQVTLAAADGFRLAVRGVPLTLRYQPSVCNPLPSSVRAVDCLQYTTQSRGLCVCRRGCVLLRESGTNCRCVLEVQL